MTSPAHGLGVAPATQSRTYAAERLIGRLLIAVTYVSVGLLAIGFALMIADGISPLAGGPPFDAATLGAQLLALDPAGFLWLGLLPQATIWVAFTLAVGTGFSALGVYLAARRPR